MSGVVCSPAVGSIRFTSNLAQLDAYDGLLMSICMIGNALFQAYLVATVCCPVHGRRKVLAIVKQLDMKPQLYRRTQKPGKSAYEPKRTHGGVATILVAIAMLVIASTKLIPATLGTALCTVDRIDTFQGPCGTTDAMRKNPLCSAEALEVLSHLNGILSVSFFEPPTNPANPGVRCRDECSTFGGTCLDRVVCMDLCVNQPGQLAVRPELMTVENTVTMQCMAPLTGTSEVVDDQDSRTGLVLRSTTLAFGPNAPFLSLDIVLSKAGRNQLSLTSFLKDVIFRQPNAVDQVTTVPVGESSAYDRAVWGSTVAESIMLHNSFRYENSTVVLKARPVFIAEGVGGQPHQMSSVGVMYQCPVPYIPRGRTNTTYAFQGAQPIKPTGPKYLTNNVPKLVVTADFDLPTPKSNQWGDLYVVHCPTIGSTVLTVLSSVGGMLAFQPLLRAALHKLVATNTKAASKCRVCCCVSTYVLFVLLYVTVIITTLLSLTLLALIPTVAGGGQQWPAFPYMLAAIAVFNMGGVVVWVSHYLCFRHTQRCRTMHAQARSMRKVLRREERERERAQLEGDTYTSSDDEGDMPRGMDQEQAAPRLGCMARMAKCCHDTNACCRLGLGLPPPKARRINLGKRGARAAGRNTIDWVGNPVGDIEAKQSVGHQVELGQARSRPSASSSAGVRDYA